MRILLLSLTLAAAGICAAWASDNKPGDEKAVRAAVDKFNAAAKAGEEATLKALISEELVYGHSNAKMENKAECVAALVKSKPNFVMEPGWTVKIFGKTAIVHGKMTAHNVQNGNPTRTPLDLLMIWVKEGSGWVLVARHTTRLPS